MQPVRRTLPPRLPALPGLPPIQDLRSLKEGERVAHWVKSHLAHLEQWNAQGWRWVQIAKAIDGHIKRKVTRNKLTGMVTMIRKNRLAKNVEAEPLPPSK